MNKKVSTFSERLNEAITFSGMTKTELSSRTGISKSSITHYCKGDWEAKQDSIYLLAHALNVSEACLMGYDVSKSRNIISSGTVPPISTATPVLQALAESVAQLNDEGQEKLVEYADDLVSSGKYSPQEAHTDAG